MTITLELFLNDVMRYMQLALTTDIKIVSEDGDVLWIIRNSKTQERVNIAESLVGILPPDITLDDVKRERLESL